MKFLAIADLHNNPPDETYRVTFIGGTSTQQHHVGRIEIHSSKQKWAVGELRVHFEIDDDHQNVVDFQEWCDKLWREELTIEELRQVCETVRQRWYDREGDAASMLKAADELKGKLKQNDR